MMIVGPRLPTPLVATIPRLNMPRFFRSRPDRSRSGRARRLSAQTLEARWALSTGGLIGTVWQDQNADRLVSPNELGQPNVTLFLDTDADGQFDPGETSTMTDADGHYLFDNLAAGTYHLGQVPPAGQVQTFPELAGTPLVFQELFRNGTAGANGLQGSEAVRVSADGRTLYVASILDNSVVLFSRDTATGALTFVEQYKDGVGGVDGLLAAHFIALSPDQKSVYVAGRGDDAVATFSRNETTGQLTFVQVIKASTANPGLSGASFVEVSADGKNVYVAGRFDNAVVVFRRNETTGLLTYIETEKDGFSGVDGLNNVRWLALSPDGRHLYTASLNDNAISTFSRNELTGRLTFLQVLSDGVGGVDGLDQAASVVVSRDGGQVYVAGSRDDAIAIFTRDAATGLLTFAQSLKNGVSGVTGLDGVIALALSPDNRFLYADGFFDDTLVVFPRNETTGLLGTATIYKDSVAGLDGLDGAHGIAISPDGSSVYVGGYLDNALVGFRAPLRTRTVTLANGEFATDQDFGNRDGALFNRPPRLTLIGNRTIDEGQSLTFLALASDSDAGDSLKFSLGPGAPQGAFILPVVGLFQWSTRDSTVDPVAITVMVSDGATVLSTDSETFLVTVRNLPPSAQLAGPSTGKVGEYLGFTALGNDPSEDDTQAGFQFEVDWEGDGTIDEIVSGPAEGVGLVHIYNAPGIYTVHVRAVDKDGGRSEEILQPVEINGSILPGDANGDGQVGSADYAIWAAQFGQAGVNLAADFDGSGEVGAGDYTIWAANFGATLGGASGAAKSAPRAAAAATVVRVAAPATTTRARPRAGFVQAVDRLHAAQVLPADGRPIVQGSPAGQSLAPGQAHDVALATGLSRAFGFGQSPREVARLTPRRR